MAISLDKGAECFRPQPISVLVVGLRGIVDVQGGIEMHARMLYPLLARLGCRVEVVQRASYYPGARRSEWHRIALTYLWSPGPSGVETAVHSLLGVLYAGVKRPDILHLHAVGPAFLAPLARLLGLRVVVTHHAADYRREKWGLFARWLLSAGEFFGMRFSNEPIVVSEVLRDDVRGKYGVAPTLIPNGAPRAVRVDTTAVLQDLALEPGRYVLCVARLDKVKRQLDLIEAFERASLPGWKLVLVGALDERDEYVRRIVARAAGNSRVALAGYRQGKALRELFSHCGCFVLPSSLEGHPIALLEALSYGATVLASDLPENRALELGRDSLFPVGDAAALAQRLENVAAGGASHADMRQVVRERYSWRRAAQLTRDVYERVLHRGESRP